MNDFRKLLPLFLAVFLFIGAIARSQPTFYRVLYNDDPALSDPDNGATPEERINLLREGYNAELIILPADEDTRKTQVIQITGPQGVRSIEWNPDNSGPLKIDGIVWHTDPEEDPKWVVGGKSRKPDPKFNPQFADAEMWRKVRKLYGIGDPGDKYNEARFLREVALEGIEHEPEKAYIYVPDTRLGSDTSFSIRGTKPEVRKEVEDRVREAMKVKSRAKFLKKLSAEDYQTLFKNAVKVELIRRRIEEEMKSEGEEKGKAILKIRGSNHSEGHLPKTNEDWIDTYLTYMLETKAEVERLAKEIDDKKSSESLADLILKLKKVEGGVLDRLVTRPKDVVAQKMVEAVKEVRVHVEVDEIGPTFLRVYHEGDYLTPQEIRSLHAAIRKMLANLKRKGLHGVALSGDFILDKKGNWADIDSNFGRQSGYSFLEEDLFTTAWYGDLYSKKKGAITREFEAFKKMKMGKEKVEALKNFRHKWRGFLKGDVAEAFWDRVLRHYRDRLMRTAVIKRQEEFNAILRELQAEGLDKGSIYVQFIEDVRTYNLRKHKLVLAVDPDMEKFIKSRDPKAEQFLGIAAAPVDHRRARVREKYRAHRHLVLTDEQGRRFLVREGRALTHDCRNIRLLAAG